MKEGDESTVSTVRVENVELATDGVGRGGTDSGVFRPIKAEIFTVEQPKSRLRCARVRFRAEQDERAPSLSRSSPLGTWNTL